MKYSVSVLSALQPETALIFKAFVWKQLPNSQFKPDLYSATSLPLPPLSPFLFSLCQVSSSPFSSPSVCSFVSSTPLVPFIFPLALYLFSFPPLLSFLYLSFSQVLFFQPPSLSSLCLSHVLSLLLVFLPSHSLCLLPSCKAKLSRGFSLAADCRQRGLYQCPFCSAIWATTSKGPGLIQ